MKNILLTLLLSGGFLFSVAQKSADTVYRFRMDSMICKISENHDPTTVFTKTEIPPQFPGGETAWKEYFTEKFKGLKSGDMVEVQFIVELDGTTNSVQVLTPSYLTKKEEKVIVDFIKESGRWFPAKQNGYCVRSWKRVRFY